MGRKVDGEWWALAGSLIVAGLGWALHATLLALVGTLAAIIALLLWVWQRECLSGVSYRRTLAQQRATFGEEVTMEIELVNDKLLPLTWLHVTDEVPRALTVRGGSMRENDAELSQQLHHLLPMLPFQRVRRRLTVICDRRGDHTFGPAWMRSGNPVGNREHFASMRELSHLLVYPKMFRLVCPPVASRVPLGNHRARFDLIGDPSRPTGVREYRAGDPLRHVDWRATARSSALLVREFEPTSTPRVAVFIDARRAPFDDITLADDVLEFAIAVGASVVGDLVDRGIATGLYCSGTVDNRPIARQPSSSPTALPAMLELLARCSPWGKSSIAELLVGEASQLRRGASAVLIAADFPESTLVALAEVRRRLPITVIWVATDHGRPPPTELVDVRWEVSYLNDWKQHDVLELAP